MRVPRSTSHGYAHSRFLSCCPRAITVVPYELGRLMSLLIVIAPGNEIDCHKANIGSVNTDRLSILTVSRILASSYKARCPFLGEAVYLLSERLQRTRVNRTFF